MTGFSWLPVRFWFIAVFVVSVLFFLALLVYKIQKIGYDRCEANYSKISAELKDASRKDILKAEKKYDEIKRELSEVRGADDPVGPRTELAIDRMPDPFDR